MKWPRVDFLPSTRLHKELELWYQQWPLVPTCLLGECRWIWLSLSWFSHLPYWLRFWVLFGGGGGYLPPSSRKDTGRGPGWNIRGISTHVLDMSGAWLKDTEKSPPSQKILGWGLAETCQGNYPPSGKVLGRGAQLGEKIQEHLGLSWKTLRLPLCRGLNGLS